MDRTGGNVLENLPSTLNVMYGNLRVCCWEMICTWWIFHIYVSLLESKVSNTMEDSGDEP
jgi:hypothetical protein